MSDIITPNQTPMLKISNEDHLTQLIVGIIATWADSHNEYITQINVSLEKRDGKKVITAVHYEAEDVNE